MNSTLYFDILSSVWYSEHIFWAVFLIIRILVVICICLLLVKIRFISFFEKIKCFK